MKVNLNVDVHHLTRVEGHGNIRVRVRNGEVREARWDVVETPRYFEAMLKGKHYSTAGILTARICGICSIGHCLASLRATEDAFGMEIPAVAKKLRWLAKHGETLQSHVLHLFFLVAPDFFKLPDAISLLEKETMVYDLSRRLKSLTDRLYEKAAKDKTAQAGASGLRDELREALFGLAAEVAPTRIGLPNVKPFMQKKPEVVLLAARLKGLGNRICDVVAGRTTPSPSRSVAWPWHRTRRNW
jgi:coenzyme F420-reducing hydrogenase alpha subunit